MNAQVVLQIRRLAMLSIVSLLALSSGVRAQVTISAGPLSLYQIRTIYIAPSSDELTRLLRSRLEKWGAMNVTTQVEEADAILTSETENRIVPAKVVVRVIDAQVRLVDRHTQKLIWSTKKSTSWDDKLADEIIDQLRKDRARSSSNY